MKPFVVVVGEPEIREALASCADLDVHYTTYSTLDAFASALEQGVVPSNLESGAVIVSDQPTVIGRTPISVLSKALTGSGIIICWRSDPLEAEPSVETISPPVTIQSLREAISEVVHVPLDVDNPEWEEPIYVPGLQETGHLSRPTPFADLGRRLGAIVTTQSDQITDTNPSQPSSSPPPAPSAFTGNDEGEDEDEDEDELNALHETVAGFDRSLSDMVGEVEPPAPPAAWTLNPVASVDESIARAGFSDFPIDEPEDLPPPDTAPVSFAAPERMNGLNPNDSLLAADVSDAPPVATPFFTADNPPVASPTVHDFVSMDTGPAFGDRQRITQICTVIGVWSSKGGVGKTTVTLNLAARIAQTGMRVLIVDLDVTEGDIGARLWIPAKNAVTIFDLDNDQSALTHLPEVLPYVKRAGLWVLPAPYSVSIGAVHAVGPYERLLKAASRDFDVIVMDCPAELTHELVLRFALRTANKVVVVIDNEIAAVAGLKRSLTWLKTKVSLSSDHAVIFVNQQVAGSGAVPMSELTDALAPYPVVASLNDARGDILRAQANGRVAVFDSGPIGNSMRESIDAVIQEVVPAAYHLLVRTGQDGGASESRRQSGFGKPLRRLIFGRD